jgi:hypothetical protein
MVMIRTGRALPHLLPLESEERELKEAGRDPATTAHSMGLLQLPYVPSLGLASQHIVSATKHGARSSSSFHVRRDEKRQANWPHMRTLPTFLPFADAEPTGCTCLLLFSSSIMEDMETN